MLLHRLAEVYSYRGRQQEAEEVYREILRQDPGDFLALNNLATILALQGEELTAALDYINLAIENQGEQPALLDSRAVVRLAAGRAEEALADLGKVLAVDPNPVTYFHQAQAFHQLGRTAAARQALAKAEGLGLRLELLHPLEVQACEQLRDKVRPD
jgi:tetratricopeptide (TPR) repeat protein